MQGQTGEGWFPVCLICGMGHMPTVVCLDPECHEDHCGKTVDPPGSRQVFADGHSWKSCALCQRWLLSDPDAWGSYALCCNCYNQYATLGIVPPSSIAQMRLHIQTGLLELGTEETGLRTSRQVVRVRSTRD